MINATVVAIKLVSFSYALAYEPAEGAEVTYTVKTLHRLHPEEKNMDVLVNVQYLAKEQPAPVLEASCLSTFHLPDAVMGFDKEDGEQTMSIPTEQGRRVTLEAISHARALIAVHTAATPFSTSHISMGEVATRDELIAQQLATAKAG